MLPTNEDDQAVDGSTVGNGSAAATAVHDVPAMASSGDTDLASREPERSAVTSAESPTALTADPAKQRTRIVPPKGWQSLNLAELWRYRELTWFLAMRDVKVRYKQTVLGVLWAVIQPALQTLIFTLVFNKVADVKGPDGVPYPLWVFCAMIPFTLFSTALTTAGNSLVGSQNLITKVYFPRLSIPISTIIAALVDFVIAFGLLIALMIFYGHVPTLAVLTLPIFVLMAVAAALAGGLWLSALNVEYRDIRYVIPFLAQIWLYATPIMYQANKVGEKFGRVGEVLYGLNPMYGVVEGFRWALLGTAFPEPIMFGVSIVATAALLVGGLYYFKRMEQNFADVV